MLLTGGLFTAENEGIPCYIICAGFPPLLIAPLFFAGTLGLMAVLTPVQAQESENTQENTEDITNLQGSAEIYRLIDRFSQIMSYVRTQYYRDVSDEELIDAAIPRDAGAVGPAFILSGAG